MNLQDWILDKENEELLDHKYDEESQHARYSLKKARAKWIWEELRK